jgi:hypothetical protein
MPDQPLPAGAKLAAPFIDLLPVNGVAIAVFDQHRRASLIYASDPTAARLEEIHFDVGEGPMFDAFASAQPVHVPNVAVAHQWPAFLSYADEERVGALFLFPLALGAACIGAVLCYTTEVGALSADDVAIGVALSQAIAGPAFRHAIARAGDEFADGDIPVELRREVHQATGMVVIQLGISPTDAFARMRAYAFTSGRSLRDVAHDVVHRSLDFTQVGG